MTDRRILVVDDEVTIAESIAHRLRGEGFVVDIAGDGPTAVAMFEELHPDLVVLDVMLPGYDGLEVCRRIQARSPVAVLMVTARGEENDQLVGLGVGADDYIAKPFGMRTLVARVHALLRRVERAPSVAVDTLRLGDLVVDRGERRVYRDGIEVHLTRTEFDLLIFLAQRPGAALARDQLLEAVWGWPDGGSRTVDSHVKALRRKLGSDLVRTVHGIGYAFRSPDALRSPDGAR
ncbi:response regulator transcription factor [Actinomycetes bacterium M1A6_2h]